MSTKGRLMLLAMCILLLAHASFAAAGKYEEINGLTKDENAGINTERTSEKASGFEEKSNYHFFRSLTCGNDAVGFDFGVRYFKDNNPKIYYATGLQYEGKFLGNTQITSYYVNIGSENELAFTEFGVNYSLWKVDRSMINGSIGYQAILGFGFNDNIKWGIKYVVYNSSYTDSIGNPVCVSPKPIMFFVSLIN